MTEVGKVPEGDRTAVVHVPSDEDGPAEEMKFADAIDGGFCFKPTLWVLCIKPNRKRLCPGMVQSTHADKGDDVTYCADCMANTAELVGSELRTTPP